MKAIILIYTLHIFAHDAYINNDSRSSKRLSLSIRQLSGRASLVCDIIWITIGRHLHYVARELEFGYIRLHIFARDACLTWFFMHLLQTR